ncbi:MAG: alcohol dehydrogenase catalytic domain-containing protein [Caldilineaceae bacterium]
MRLQAAGVCQPDLHTYKGELRTVPPVVLGHEGAGIVEAVGSNITDIAPGDRVLVNWLPACGHCPTCRAGRPTLCVNAFPPPPSNPCCPTRAHACTPPTACCSSPT